MRILYFARLRQIIGRGQDDIALPAEVTTAAALVEFLKARDERIAEAFGDLRTLKVAINQKHSALDASLAGATEVAFFPPVTGG
jgi:molybdopterin synthase sulfur carrier subunit